MKLVLKNIGKVQNATVEINGITVIAGENDTGKSTVGKALFSVFNSFYNIDKKLASEREGSIYNQLQSMLRESLLDEYFYINPSELAKEVITFNEKKETGDELKKRFLMLLQRMITEFPKLFQKMQLRPLQIG